MTVLLQGLTLSERFVSLVDKLVMKDTHQNTLWLLQSMQTE